MLNRHLSESELALAQTGDLAWWRQRLAARHLAACPVCSQAAGEFSEAASQLRALGGEPPAEPAWLAGRILAAAASTGRQTARRTTAAVVAEAAALGLLCILALQFLGMPRTIAPSRAANVPAAPYRALATREAITAETSGRFGQQRIVLYTSGKRGSADLSAGRMGGSVMQADPVTGAITITRLIVEE